MNLMDDIVQAMAEKQRNQFYAELLQKLDSIDVRPQVNVTTEEVSLEPVLKAIGALKVAIAEVAAKPAPDLNLDPIVSAMDGVSLDLSPILDAIKQIPQPDVRPQKWKLIHHRDPMGRLIETEAIAE